MAIQSAREMVLIAKSHERKGEIDLARKQYELVLKRFPHNLRAKRALNEINAANSNSNVNDPPRGQVGKMFALMNSQKFSDAVQFGKQLAASYPESALLWNVIGGANGSLGRWADAEQDFRKAIKAEPGYPDSYNNLGNALKEQGKLEKACDVYRTAIEMDQNYAQAHYNLGVALKDQNLFKEAQDCFVQALKIDSNYVEALNNHAILLREQGKLDDAIEKLQRAVKLRPEMVEIHSNLSDVYRQKGELDTAKEWVDLALAIQPDNPIALHNRGRLFIVNGQLDQALTDLKRAVVLVPMEADAWCSLADAYSEMQDSDAAIEHYKRALEFNALLRRAYSNLSQELISQGKLEEAKDELWQIAKKSNWDIEPYYHYVLLSKGGVSDEDRERIEEICKRSAVEPSKEISARFSLYEIYKRRGVYDKAFVNVEYGNSLRDDLSRYEIEKDKKYFKKIKRGFNDKKLEVLTSAEDSSESFSPTFILGMPRSGTSLVEQILSRHTNVDAAGELQLLRSVIHSLKLPGKRAKRADLVKLRELYLKGLKGFGGNKRYITDKMPHNFINVGYILTSMPHAKVVHTVRDARATCWSNFEQNFTANTGLGYSNSLSGVTEFYAMYREMMEFWHEKFPGQIYDLNYEALTKNQEEETRKLLKFLDLDWEDACLSFEKSDRAVKTASYLQVKEKMYTGSSEKWRNYEPYLGDFVKSLEGY